MTSLPIEILDRPKDESPRTEPGFTGKSPFLRDKAVRSVVRIRFHSLRLGATNKYLLLNYRGGGNSEPWIDGLKRGSVVGGADFVGRRVFRQRTDSLPFRRPVRGFESGNCGERRRREWLWA
jgi:hypothetical protein